MRSLDCEPDDIFKPQLFTPEELAHWVFPPIADAGRLAAALLPPAARAAVQSWSFVAAPMQIHAAVMAVFASFVAPFGKQLSLGSSACCAALWAAAWASGEYVEACFPAALLCVFVVSGFRMKASSTPPE